MENGKKKSNIRGQSIQIKIKTLNGLVCFINVSSQSSIASIQNTIEQKTGVPLNAQRLLHKAVLLQPSRYLFQYGINDGDTIQLIANMLPEQTSSPTISSHRQNQIIRINNLTQQNLKSKKHRYLQQRINGFGLRNQQSIETLKQNKIAIDRGLLACINSKQVSTQPFLMQNRQLLIGDWVDVKDVSGLWIEAQIVNKRHNFVQIHCNGYPDCYNQWIQQGSQRIMPLRTQTVQSEDSPYLSPFPINKPQIKSVKYSEDSLEKILTELPQTFRSVISLLEELEPNAKKQPNGQQLKYSFNEQQQQDKAQSFKNNRSQHSPPHSIHQQQYQYQDYQAQMIKISMINPGQCNQGQTSSIKGMTKIKNSRNKLMRSTNRYIYQSKNSLLGYSKTKSQHQHTLHHEQTPQKNYINTNQRDKKQKQTIIRNFQDDHQLQLQLKKNKKYQQMDLQQQLQTTKIQLQQTNQLQPSNLIGNIIKTDKQENISNKGQHDDGQSSAKSFGSKKQSDRFLDTSSMKSLNIDTIHSNHNTMKNHKYAEGKKNIFIFDQSEAQSVKQMQNKQNSKILQKSNYNYNQQYILQQQNSQINQQINQQHFMQKKKQVLWRLRATQLAPVCDRLGRLLVDLAPHLAMMGYQQYNQNQIFNENLSTFTNEGSLQSRLRSFNQGGTTQQQLQDKSSYRSNKYWNFQVPVMLTPWEIMKLNRLLAEDHGENQ